MANKVKFGLKNVYYAVATINAVDNTATYATPVAWPGAVSLSLDAEGEQTIFRADNIDYWTQNSNNGYSGELETALIPDSFYTSVLGYITDSDGVVLEDASASTVPFALLFQFEGDDKATRHVLYKCTATRPSISGQTTEEEIEPQTETVNITAGIIHNSAVNKDFIKASCKDGDTEYSGWFGSVHQSTTL